jgi:uncharacterized protein (TIGR03067 family)
MEERVMRQLLAISIVLVCIGSSVADDNAAEMKKFAGTWKVKDGSADGIALPAEARAVARLSFGGNTFSFKGGPSERSTTFTVDAASQTIVIAPPKGENRTLRGRYKFDRSTLTLCLTDGAKTPETLAGGKDRLVLTLEKDK